MLCQYILYFSTIGVGFIGVYQHYWGRFYGGLSALLGSVFTAPGTPPPVNSTSAPPGCDCMKVFISHIIVGAYS